MIIIDADKRRVGLSMTASPHPQTYNLLIQFAHGVLFLLWSLWKYEMLLIGDGVVMTMKNRHCVIWEMD